MNFIKLRALLELMRFHFHLSFVSVILGALLFAPVFNGQLFWQLTQLYLLFNVLLYGGIYSLNDFVDRNEDGQHPTKCRRPIPSGRISPQLALSFALLLISTALFLGWLLQPALLVFFGLFLLANVAYSGFLKPIPYAGLSMIAATHTLRFFMGASVAGGVLDLYFGIALYSLLYVIAFTIHGLFNAKPEHRQFYPGWLIFTIDLLGGVCILLCALYSSMGSHWILILIVYGVFISWAALPPARKSLALLFMAKPKS